MGEKQGGRCRRGEVVRPSIDEAAAGTRSWQARHLLRSDTSRDSATMEFESNTYPVPLVIHQLANASRL
jgi:hypothetical protein